MTDPSHSWRQRFREAPPFKRLSDDQAQRLLEAVEHHTYRSGEEVFAEGSERHRIFFILRGSVDLTRRDAYGAVRPVVSLGAGDMLGEGMLIRKSIHSTTCTAAVETEVVLLRRERLDEVLAGDAPMVQEILESLLDEIVGRLDQLLFRNSSSAVGFASGRTRPEHDLLGDGQVPSEAYFGIQTQRALTNFDIGGQRLHAYPNLIRALGMVKKACAFANRDCNALDVERADAIGKAADDVVAGKLNDHFVVDMLQGGAGTSTNMNANEVIANRALELLGHEKGDYQHLHPNNHVNCSQSTNDVYPSALKLAIILSSERLIETVRGLIESCQRKAIEFDRVVKMGRTQLQDAVPMTLGQEFSAFATSLQQELDGLERNRRGLHELNLGGTAIGTRLNAPCDYPQKAVDYLEQISGLQLSLSGDLIEATADTRPFVMYSCSLKSLAIKLSKICNDLRLLSSGPRAGLGEIRLPARQPGSSIMPGKVNPVIPEVVNQVAYRVIGNDLAVTMAAEAGQLQLNVMEPVIAANILESLKILANAVATLTINCIDGIEANIDRCKSDAERSIGLVTALVPVLGYDVTTKVAAEALASDRTVAEVLEDRGLMNDDIAARISPERMAHPS